MADRFNLQSQLEHLQSKHIGTGHADITKYEWAVNQHRDTYASYVSHHSMLDFFAIAQGQTRQRVRHDFLKHILCCSQRMVKPVGSNPNKQAAAADSAET